MGRGASRVVPRVLSQIPMSTVVCLIGTLTFRTR